MADLPAAFKGMQMQQRNQMQQHSWTKQVSPSKRADEFSKLISVMASCVCCFAQKALLHTYD